MGATCVNFGKDYGNSKFHTRLDTLHGEQPVIFCRQNQIWYVGMFWVIVHVKNVGELQNLCFISSGSVLKLRKLGVFLPFAVNDSL